MDFGDERYVRVFVRDTATMKLIGWEGRNVFFSLLRKVDRAGVLDFGEEGPAEAIAAVTDIPLDLVRVGLQRLMERGCVVVQNGCIVIVKFLEAQESPQSDKHRQRESRAKRRDLARHGVTKRDASEDGNGVTKRDVDNTKRDASTKGAEPPAVTKPVAPVTKPVGGDGKTVETVTPYRTVPYRTDPDLSLSGDAEDLKRSAHEEPPPRRRRREPESGNGAAHRFQMHRDWKPNADSIAAVRVTTLGEVTEGALRVFTGEFTGHFGQKPEEECTDGEWNQRWQKWVQRGWNNPDKRPKQPTPSGMPVPPQDFSDPLSLRILGRKI